MAVAVARAPRRAPTKPRARRPAARKAASTRRVAGGAVFIVMMAVLLTGVVALNVAVLRLNLTFEELAQERAKLRAENAEISTKLATRISSPRTSSLAKRALGVEPADSSTTTYLNLTER